MHTAYVYCANRRGPARADDCSCFRNPPRKVRRADSAERVAREHADAAWDEYEAHPSAETWELYEKARGTWLAAGAAAYKARMDAAGRIPALDRAFAAALLPATVLLRVWGRR